MNLLFGHEVKFLLRWRFDFFDSKPARYGIWNHAGTSELDYAWCVNKTNLLRASIESKCIVNNTIRPVVEVDGPEFVNFKWVGCVKMPINFKNKIKKQTCSPINVGLTLVNREHEITFFIDGQLKIEERSEQDKMFHYACFGK